MSSAPSSLTVLGDASRVSVVIPTRNRGESLVPTIRSIFENEHPDFEVIVIDQSTNDVTKKALADIQDPRLHFVHSTEVGTGRARNLGVAKARAEIVLMTDDDCVVPPDWIKTMVQIFRDHPSVAVAYCNVVAAPHDQTAGFIPAYHCTQDTVLETIQQKKPGVSAGIGAGMGMRRSVLREIGGFDPMLGPGGHFRSGEETDLTIRTLMANHQVLSTPRTSVIHSGFRTWEEGRALTRRDCFATGAVCAKHVQAYGGRFLVIPVIHFFRFMGMMCADLYRQRRLTGLLRITSLVTGFMHGIRTPIDRQRVLFQDQKGPSDYTRQ